MVEYMMPKGLRQYLESYRFATQGMQFTNGEVMLDPRNIDLTSLMRNAIGLPDNEIQQLKWTRGQQIEMERYFSERQTRLTNEFVTARQDGNRERQSEIREEWMELQRAKRRVRPFFNNAPNALRFTPPSQLIRTATNRRRNARNDRRMLGTE
jgi:hypothetical protein